MPVDETLIAPKTISASDIFLSNCPRGFSESSVSTLGSFSVDVFVPEYNGIWATGGGTPPGL